MCRQGCPARGYLDSDSASHLGGQGLEATERRGAHHVALWVRGDVKLYFS